MTFRSLGQILQELTSDAGKLRAAAVETAPQDFVGDEPSTGEEFGSDPSPMRVGRARNLNGKGRERLRPPASLEINEKQRQPLVGMHVKEPSPRVRPVLRMVSSKCLDTAHPNGSPRPVVSRHLMLVARDHAASPLSSA